MTAAIRVENLGKRYRVGRTRDRGAPQYRTLREELSAMAAGPLRRLRGRAAPPSTEDFWALAGVDFEVQPGEVVGIIGRNGAGKSTLLKLLSRITRPTTGRALIRGRVGSLLEVGTGFHPELTGRENIYLNGSVLGMSRQEIRRAFDAIVAFSGVERFLDTPVKRYSSGMQVRLAFAVSAHLEPEVLVVDEVLAVGDYEFQKKCLGKMSDVARSGRTILFVSHNLDAVARLTHRCLLLRGGRVACDGPPLDVIRTYLASDAAILPEWRCADPDLAKTVALTSVRVCDAAGELKSHLNADEAIRIAIEFRVAQEVPVQIAFRLVSAVDEQIVFTSGHGDAFYTKCTRISPGRHRVHCELPANFLRPGTYHLLVAANRSEGGQFDLVDQAVYFEVSSIGSLVNLDNRLGLVTPLLAWSAEEPDGEIPDA
jgi:lipopolysaccharide transport system ATP-binding protein